MEFNYLAERTRMFNSLGRTDGMCIGVRCDDCPFYFLKDRVHYDCYSVEAVYPLKATEIVKRWAEEHPKKNRKTVLLEKFPNAKLDSSTRRPLACADDLGFCTECENFDTCEECWNMEVEE